jgi:hypothetical protein
MACIRIDDLPILEELGQEELQGIYGEGLFPSERLRQMAAAATLGITLAASPFAVAGGQGQSGRSGNSPGPSRTTVPIQTPHTSGHPHGPIRAITAFFHQHQHDHKDHGKKNDGPVIPIDPPGVPRIPIDPPGVPVNTTVRDHRDGATGSAPSGGVTVTPADPKVNGGVTVVHPSQPITLPTFPSGKDKGPKNGPGDKPNGTVTPTNDVIGTGPDPIRAVGSAVGGLIGQAVGAITGGHSGSGPTLPGTPPPAPPTGPTIRDHR